MSLLSLSADALRHDFLARHLDLTVAQALGLSMVGQGAAQTLAQSQHHSNVAILHRGLHRDKRRICNHCRHHGQSAPHRHRTSRSTHRRGTKHLLLDHVPSQILLHILHLHNQLLGCHHRQRHQLPIYGLRYSIIELHIT